MPSSRRASTFGMDKLSLSVVEGGPQRGWDEEVDSEWVESELSGATASADSWSRESMLHVLVVRTS